MGLDGNPREAQKARHTLRKMIPGNVQLTIRRALRAFREVLADEGFDALLAQVLPDHLELALGVAAETVQRDDDGQP